MRDHMARRLRVYAAMNAEITRLTLLAQHERLREQVQTCTRLAKLYRLEQRAVGVELDAALGVLREQFAIHNEAETTVIRRDGARIVLAFDPQVVAPAELIRRVTSRHAVKDLFVENPPIETIIARLYETVS